MATGTNVLAVDGAQKLSYHSTGTIRVLLSCSGIGILDRGIETFFREAFDGLRNLDGVETLLIKGGGPPAESEKSVWNLPRTGRLAPALGRLAHRSSYVIEQWSTFLPVVRQIRRFEPHIIFYSDANLGFLLYWFRNWIGVPYRLLFSNGGPCHPPFIRTDFVHQVAPHYYNEAIAADEPATKHHLVPYGIHVPPQPPVNNLEAQRQARSQFNLPQDRKIVLSVGWVSRQHKRMDYVIREIAALPAPRPFLQLLGTIDNESQEIIDLGLQMLGPQGFSARSVPYEDVANYYRAADVFVLASLSEGFGRVLLEAMMHGLPVVAHRHPVMEFVVGDAGRLEDLSAPGTLTTAVSQLLAQPDPAEMQEYRWNSVRTRFDWQALRSSYREMFFRCAANVSRE
jgi:1,2-diacylglycerol 3-alpha-glucosyltransferase